MKLCNLWNRADIRQRTTVCALALLIPFSLGTAQAGDTLDRMIENQLAKNTIVVAQATRPADNRRRDQRARIDDDRDLDRRDEDPREMMRKLRRMSCKDLWTESYRVLHENGYCLRSKRGRESFTKDGCSKNFRDVWKSLPREAKKRVNRVRMMAFRKEC